MTYSVSSANKVQLRRDTAAKWAAANPKLLSGEIGFETDTQKFKIGNGSTAWTTLGYAASGTLAELEDINITSPANGQVLKYNGNVWINGADDAGTTISSIDDITDVAITSVQTGDLLKWSGSNWVNASGFALLASPTFTGTVTVPTPTNNTNAATKAYVDNGLAGVISHTAVADGLVVRYVAAADVADYAGQYNNGAGYAIGDIVSTGVNSPYGDSGELFIRISNPGNPGYPPSTASWGTYSHLTSPAGGSLAIFAVDENVMQARVADVTDTEISYLSSVTSAIQTQIDNKAPLASPTFTGTVTANNVTVSGNLTVSGTTTSINTETLTINDNIIVLNNNATGSPTENAGIEVERGSGVNVSIRWNEETDKWQVTENGSTFVDLVLPPGEEVSLSLEGLNDVVFTAPPANGQFLKYDGTASNWIAANLPIISTLDDVGDVVFTSLSNDQFIKRVNGQWVNYSFEYSTNTVIDAVGDILVGSANNTLERLAIGQSDYVLQSNGATPIWSKLPDNDQAILASRVFR